MKSGDGRLYCTRCECSYRTSYYRCGCCRGPLRGVNPAKRRRSEWVMFRRAAERLIRLGEAEIRGAEIRGSEIRGGDRPA